MDGYAAPILRGRRKGSPQVHSPLPELVQPSLSDSDFDAIARLLHEQTGIDLSPAKKAMVAGRLARHLGRIGVRSFAEYVVRIRNPVHADERQACINLLTTNETSFFREPKHFEWLRARAAEARRDRERLRIWSAASSSGEEAYSAAMVCEDVMPGGTWEITGTDISTRMVASARRGLYPIAHAAKVPGDYLRRFCLRGVGPQEGTLLVHKSLRDRVTFKHANLVEPLPSLGVFQVIFLRNVMIYFNTDTRRDVIERVVSQLAPGGHLLIGHSESIHDLTERMKFVAPAIYRKVH